MMWTWSCKYDFKGDGPLIQHGSILKDLYIRVIDKSRRTPYNGQKLPLSVSDQESPEFPSSSASQVPCNADGACSTDNSRELAHHIPLSTYLVIHLYDLTYPRELVFAPQLSKSRHVSTDSQIYRSSSDGSLGKGMSMGWQAKKSGALSQIYSFVLRMRSSYLNVCLVTPAGRSCSSGTMAIKGESM